MCLCSCQSDSTRGIRHDPKVDSVYQEAFSVAFSTNSPDSALMILDRAREERLLTPVYASYLQQQMLYSTTYAYDSILSVNSRLLDTEEATDNLQLRYRILLLMSNVAYSGNHFSEMMLRATETARLAHQMDYSQTVDALRLMVSVYAELGDYDKLEKAYREIDAVRGADTINDSYVQELTFKYQMATARGDRNGSFAYLKRLDFVKDSLSHLHDKEKMAELATLYRVQEEQLRANDAEAHSRMLTAMTIPIVIAAVLALALALTFYWQKRIIARKNRFLAKDIEQTHIYKEKYEVLKKESAAKQDALSPVSAGAASSTDAELFAQIDTLMRERKLYLDPNMQRQVLVELTGIDKNRIAQLIHDHSGYPNLPAYINSFRLEYGYRLIRQGDTSTIAAIAEKAGFANVRTFQKLFKEEHGMSPTEYRISIR